MLIKILTFWLPLSALAWISRTVGRAPPHIAQAFSELVKSPHAVQQTACMLRDLSRVSQGDFWKDSIVRSSDMPNSKSVELKFYFAKSVSLLPTSRLGRELT